MKKRFIPLLAITLAAVLSLGISGCGGSSSEESDTSEKEEQVEEKGPKTRVNDGIDCDVEFVSLDENGITFNLSMPSQNITIYPKNFDVAGNHYSFLESDGSSNPKVHLTVDDSEKDSSIVDILEGETHKVHVAIDGVTDYTHFKMTVDNTVFTLDDLWPIKNVSLEIITE